MWSIIDKERYYGVELNVGKGVNSNDGAKQAVLSLDLLQFNLTLLCTASFAAKSRTSFGALQPKQDVLKYLEKDSMARGRLK
ncbi:MAG: hypothetical protein FWE44_03680 [Defluviitaleaceae bacterium]|nr:hypothetical protein [Defluviitaleaceae bacterium]